MSYVHLLSQLTLEEKIQLTAGQDFWRTFSLPRHSIPYAKLTDGPNGARGGGDFQNSVPAALFPSPSCLSSTFDVSLARAMGEGIALDSLSKRCHISLAPTINITRDQRYGRAFENYGEDPLLSGHIGAHWTLGCQSVGVGATPKHFVLNEAEEDRRFSDSQVSQEAMREVYLEPFRTLFHEVAKGHKDGSDGEKSKVFGGQPACIMTAYNRVNGTSASENKFTLIDVLRKEWGWKGLVMSDWFALHSHALLTCDLEMPGPTIYRSPEAIKELIKKGDLSEADVDARATKVLELLEKIAPLGFVDSPDEEHEESIVDAGREEKIRTIATEGAVLLRNESETLPLDFVNRKTRKIALIGKPWKEPVQSGGGSANLTPQLAKPAFESLHEALDALPNGAGKDVELSYHFGCEIHRFPVEPKGEQRIPGGVKAEWFKGPHPPQPEDEDKEPAPLLEQHLAAPTLRAMDPKPDVLEANNFSLRATFSLVSQTAGRHKLGLTSLGNIRAIVTRQNGEEALDWKYEGARDVFSYFLDEYRTAQDGRVKMEAGEKVTVTLLYSPAQIEGDLAQQKSSAFRCGFDEEIDDKGEIEAAASLASSADVAIVMTAVGKDWESEGYDRPHLRLPRLQSELVERVAKAQKDTILVNVSGSAVELPFANQLKALVQTWYGGQEAGAAIVDILLGKGRAPASGRLCTTWPISVQDQPGGSSLELFPGKDLTGRGHPDVKYAEGRLVGYKWYEAKGIRPAHYFGSGIGGYTTFERKLLQVEAAIMKQEKKVEVAVEVTNTGKRSGKDVVQVYIAPPSDLIQGDVPHKELAAFSSVHLSAGEKTTLRLSVGERAFSHWRQDEQGGSGHWEVVPGEYHVILASSADPKDEIAREPVTVEKGWTWSGLGIV
ncbi:glycoside hydrolase [Microstroma glucosiphilum]|uniref:beta-glucosidase n=1 Tax=Pseudomicrostroma glucosiphilum TaxID=1684307 RepID=A0A316UK83_9BASI|nr:glycoside hydrolase [Pseudomicrostroma glucosiphilum]PWN23635.1 glycoside hydrolase [Pseudomicrostroma glucosiphilum]